MTGIKVYSTDAAADSIVLEVEGVWASHQDVQLTVRATRQCDQKCDLRCVSVLYACVRR